MAKQKPTTKRPYWLNHDCPRWRHGEHRDSDFVGDRVHASAVPTDLLASEMQRLTRTLAEAEAEIAAADSNSTDIEQTLNAALAAAGNCEAAYLTASDETKRQINQGFFRKLFVNEDGTIASAKLTEPFAALLTNSTQAASNRTSPSAVFEATWNYADATTESNQNNTDREHGLAVVGVNALDVVGRAGLEPAAKGL